MSEVIYWDYINKVFYDDQTGYFYIEDELGNLKNKIHILDELSFSLDSNLYLDVINQIKQNKTDICKTCGEEFIIVAFQNFCSSLCKTTYKQELRKHQNYLLSEEIDAIKDRISNCEYCNILLTKDNKSADHILPLKEYKHNHYDNIAVVCKSCNSSKADKDLLGWAESKNLKLPKHIINHYYWLKNNI